MWRIGMFFKVSRKRIASLIERIPRKVQVAINLMLIPLLLLLFYIVIHSPTATPEQAYRRFEKANLVGPSEILGYETITRGTPAAFMLAESADGYIISAVKQPQHHQTRDFFYLQKTGDITVCPAPQELYWEFGGELVLTIFLFDEYPAAEYAELDFELYWENGRNAYRKWHSLKATRNNPGYFRFDLEHDHNQFEVDPLAESIYQLSRVLHFPNDRILASDAYPITVRLYDDSGKLIVEKKSHMFP